MRVKARKVYGSYEHSIIARTLNNIGLLLVNQGKYEEALNNYNQSLAIARKVYGNFKHPFVKQTLRLILKVIFA